MSDEILSREQSVEEYLRRLQNLEFPATLDRSRYVVVHGKNLLIAREQSDNGLYFHAAREGLVHEGYRLPKIDVFMRHYCNVQDAALGKTELYDGNGRKIEKGEAESLWDRVSTDCRIWLDALFQKNRQGHLFMESDYQIKHLKQDYGWLGQISSRKVLLEMPVQKDCYVDLEFNVQGMPLRCAERQKYVRGSTLQFSAPADKSVAWFSANSGESSLFCHWNPSNSGFPLQVFRCAEGKVSRAVSQNSNDFGQYEIELQDGVPEERYFSQTEMAQALHFAEQSGHKESGKVLDVVRNFLMSRNLT